MNQATAAAAHFFLQLVVILSACALMRALMRRIGQAPVVGEMIAVRDDDDDEELGEMPE